MRPPAPGVVRGGRGLLVRDQRHHPRRRLAPGPRGRGHRPRPGRPRHREASVRDRVRPPIADDEQNRRTRRLSRLLAAAATDEGVPYLDVFDALRLDEVWMAEVAAGDGAHPGAAGYARLADLVLAWPAWPLGPIRG